MSRDRPIDAASPSTPSSGPGRPQPQRRIRTMLSDTLHDVRSRPAQAVWLGVAPAVAYLLATVAATTSLFLALLASVGFVYRMEEEYLIPLMGLALLPVFCLVFGLGMSLPQAWFARKLRNTWFPHLAAPSAGALPLVMAATLFMAATTLGLILGVLPGIMLGALFELTIPAMVVHGLSMRKAGLQSLRHFLRHPGWRTRFSLCNAVVLYGLWTFLPVVGIPLGFTAYTLCALHAYIAWFGDGPVPRRPS